MINKLLDGSMSIGEIFHHLVWLNELIEVAGLVVFIMALLKNVHFPIPHALKHLVKDNEKVLAAFEKPKPTPAETKPTAIQDGNTLLLTGSLADHTLRLASELHDAKSRIEQLELLLELNSIDLPKKK